MLLSLGSVSFVMAWHCAVLLLISVMSINTTTRGTKAFKFMRKQLFFNEPIVLLQLAYLVMLVGTLLNFKLMMNSDSKEEQSGWTIFSNILAVVIAIALVIMPVVTFIKLIRVQCSL